MALTNAIGARTVRRKIRFKTSGGRMKSSTANARHALHIRAFIDERLPEGKEILDLLLASGLNFLAAPTSGTVELDINGTRVSGAKAIKDRLTHSLL